MERPSGSIQKHLATLGVDAEVVQRAPGMETLKVKGRSIDEIRVMAHSLPTRGAVMTTITGEGRHKSYYEVHYFVRGYPFNQTEAQKRSAALLSRVLRLALLADVTGLILLGFLQFFLNVESKVVPMLFWVVLAETALLAIVVMWRRSWLNRHWRAETVRLDKGFKWRGGAIAGVLNQETRINGALTSDKRMKIYISPNRKQGLVEIRSGLFDSLQEAVPSREAFDAYDGIARRLRQGTRAV